MTSLSPIKFFVSLKQLYEKSAVRFESSVSNLLNQSDLSSNEPRTVYRVVILGNFLFFSDIPVSGPKSTTCLPSWLLFTVCLHSLRKVQRNRRTQNRCEMDRSLLST